MEDRLEKFVINNRDDFEVNEPDPVVWANIQDRLHQKSRRRKHILWAGRVAAAFLIFASAFMFQEYRYNNALSDDPDAYLGIEQNIPQLLEAKVYFDQTLNAKMTAFEEMTENYPEIKVQVCADIEELDKVYQDLKRDLGDDIANQEVVEAMMNNYRMRLQVLEDVMAQLNKSNPKENNLDHENKTRI